MLTIVQQLALRRILEISKGATDSHDQLAAWSGLGASIFTLSRQRDVRTSPGRLFLILLYLGCLSALHITTPALFSTTQFGILPKGSVGYEAVVTVNIVPASVGLGVSLVLLCLNGILTWTSWK